MQSNKKLDKIISDIKSKVQKALDRNVLSSNDDNQLQGFIKYILAETIDRKMAIEILKALDYDSKFSWEDIQEEFGQFEAIEDIALANMILYLKRLRLDRYESYK